MTKSGASKAVFSGRLCPLAFALFLAVTSLAGDLAAAPQPPPLSADEILRRALDARGGEAAAAGVQSFHCKGTVDLAASGRGNWEMFAARTNRARLDYDFGGSSHFQLGFDGRTGWEITPGAPPKILSGDQLRESQDGAALFAWYDDPRGYRSVTYAGETSFEGAKCYALKLLTASGREETHYYNATTYLLAGVSERVTLDTGPCSQVTIFKDYCKFAGFALPTRLRFRLDENEWVLRVLAVDVNAVSNAVFQAPAPPPKEEPKTTEPPAALSDAEIKASLRDCIDLDKLGVGLAVGLLDTNGTRVVCYGKLDNGTNVEVTGDTLFELGSITKVFTRLLLHDMVARGEMDLDDPVQKYLPASARMPTRHGKRITLWDLSTHTSGLPRDMSGPQTPEHLYSFLSHHKLRRDPGDAFEYSNVGMALLGHVISLKAGQPYETLVRERICRPLHMDSTVIKMTPELEARRAVGHAPANRKADYIGLKELPGAGALFSSVNDMLKFASATLGLTPFPLTPLMKRTDFGHNGGTFGFSTMLAFDRKQERALVVLSNVREDELIVHFQHLLDPQPPRPPGTMPVSAAALDRCVGQYYVREQRARTVRRDGDRLLLQELGRPSCELFRLSETNFANQLFGCRATFIETNQSRSATELLLGDPANPSWRGARLPGQVLEPSAAPLTDADCRPRKDSDLQGVWQGTLRLWYWPFVSLRFRARIAEPSPGAFRAEGDSPDQDAFGQPLGIVYDRPNVEVIVLSGDGFFEGKLNAAHTKVTGHWKQSGHSVRVTFHRAP